MLYLATLLLMPSLEVRSDREGREAVQEEWGLESLWRSGHLAQTAAAQGPRCSFQPQNQMGPQ